ncbi:site-2 protease family protein [[Brevibacterium] frigoritolerans]|nr:site-2 protease family protein [Peribacillus frigoritolerans]
MNRLQKWCYNNTRSIKSIALGIFLSYVWTTSGSFVASIISLAALIISYKLGVILHEIGHLIGAFIFKVPVSGMTIGTGKNVFTIEKRNFTFVLNRKGNSGKVKITLENDEKDNAFERFRKPILYLTLCGPIMTVILIVSSFYLNMNAPVKFEFFTKCIFVGQILLLFGLKMDIKFMKSLIKNENWAQKYKVD